MAFHGAYDLHPLVFFGKNIRADLMKLGIESEVTVAGNSIIYVEFESQHDMNLYKLVGNYKESSKVKFFASGESHEKTN
jgi:hypothetical protein